MSVKNIKRFMTARFYNSVLPFGSVLKSEGVGYRPAGLGWLSMLFRYYICGAWLLSYRLVRWGYLLTHIGLNLVVVCVKLSIPGPHLRRRRLNIQWSREIILLRLKDRLRDVAYMAMQDHVRSARMSRLTLLTRSLTYRAASSVGVMMRRALAYDREAKAIMAPIFAAEELREVFDLLYNNATRSAAVCDITEEIIPKLHLELLDVARCVMITRQNSCGGEGLTGERTAMYGYSAEILADRVIERPSGDIIVKTLLRFQGPVKNFVILSRTTWAASDTKLTRRIPDPLPDGIADRWLLKNLARGYSVPSAPLQSIFYLKKNRN